MRKSNAKFSDEVRRAIDASGLSRYRICKEIGLPEASMSRFMAGKTGLETATLDRLAAFLNLHVDTSKLRKGV